MKSFGKIIALLGLGLAVGNIYTQPAHAQSAAGPTVLIDNGVGIENFMPVGDANWRVEDDALVADDGAGGFLVTKQSYQNFILTAEFWADDNTNSGVYFRCANADVITDTSCYEANIFDQRPEAQFGSGAIVHIAPVTELHATGKRWNTLRVSAIGASLAVVLNGVQTVNVRDTQLRKGPIALQYGILPPNNTRGGVIKWRRVEIKPL